MDRSPGNQLGEFLASPTVTSPLVFEQGLESTSGGPQSEVDSLFMLVKELDRIDPGKLGNIPHALLQEYEQYQLLQIQLSEALAHSTKLYTEMQSKLNDIISSFKALLMEHCTAQHAPGEKKAPRIAVASAIPLLADQLTEYAGASASALKKEGLPPTFSATCLRPFKVEIDSKPVDLCSNRNGQTILRYLVAHPEHRVTTDTFRDILWPEDEVEVSSRKLQVTVSILRRSLNNASGKALKSGYILYKQHTYLLNPSIPLHIDVDDFLALHATGSRADPESAIRYFEQACDIYARPFLMEDIYADWSFLRREQLRHIHLHMCAVLAEHYLAAHSYHKAAHWASMIIEENHCDEAAYRILMKAYTLEGRRSEAIRQFQRCQEILLTELAMQPLPETVALYQTIANGELTSLY